MVDNKIKLKCYTYGSIVSIHRELEINAHKYTQNTQNSGVCFDAKRSTNRIKAGRSVVPSNYLLLCPIVMMILKNCIG